MKLQQLFEMPIMAKNLRSEADSFAERNKDSWSKLPHTADIDNFKIKSKGRKFSLWDNDICVAFFDVDKIPNHYVIVDDVWVSKEYSNKKIFSKFLWFLKSRLNEPKIIFGKVHSEETVNLLRHGGLSKFKKSWINLKTDELKEFSKDEIDEFYSNPNWSLMLENYSEEFHDFPKFSTDESWIKESYDWQIQ